MENIELFVNEANQKDGVFAISVVKNPAIEEDFIALSAIEVELKTVNEEKRLLLGAVLVPDKLIPRKAKDGSMYNIHFSAETIRKCSELYLMRSQQNNATYEHSRPIDDMSVVESWIVEDSEKDKSALHNLSYPIGTWVVCMKCNNDQVWNDVKSGAIKGFSIEGKFDDSVKMSELEVIDQLRKIWEDQ